MNNNAFTAAFDVHDVFAPTPTEPSYALVRSGPPVLDEEVESHVDAIEVQVRWGTQVLRVAHLSKSEGFFVGEGCDLALPEDVIDSARTPIVVRRGIETVVVVPDGATGLVDDRGAIQPFDGSREITLRDGMKVTIELGATRADGSHGEPVTIEIATVRAGKKAPIGFMAALAGGATGFVALSFLGHAAVVACLAMFMPKMGADDTDAIDRESLLMMQKMLIASAEREQESIIEPAAGASEPSGGSSQGAPHHGESGASGTSKPVTTNGRMSFRGQDHDRALSRREEIEQAATEGFVGFLVLSRANDPNAPASPWAKEFHGDEENSRWGKMYGQSIDDAAGFGVGFLGAGEGGGGHADVLGDGNVNTVGGGGGGPGKWGFGKGDKDGMGNGHARIPGGYVPHGITMREPPITETTGRLPAEVIQRIVRQNFGRFRLCYEAGLRSNPALTGRVSTKFAIGRDGLVSQASDGGSDLPDRAVVQCIVRGFSNLTFPPPEGGVALVTYPIILSPGQ